jgi:hypothetical protein
MSDVTKSQLPVSKTFLEMADDLLGRFPQTNKEHLLRLMVSWAFFNMRFGNKREERAACEFLNELQDSAAKLGKATTPTPTP